MANSFFNIPNSCASDVSEKSLSSSCPSLLQTSSIIQARKTIRPPPGFSSAEKNLLNIELVRQQSTENSLPKQNQVPFVPKFNKYFSHDHSRAYCHFRYRQFGYGRRKQFQKSSYILSIIKADYFKELGAIEHVKGIHLITRQYEPENSSRETCATLGLTKQWVYQLPYRFNYLYSILRSLPALESVPGIQDLNPYKLNVLKSLMKYVNEIGDDELILLNIEPKGQTDRSQHYYPTANICLPGGGMEKEDESDWKKTAFREFEEETGFKLDENHIKLINQQKWNSLDREAMYIILKIEKLIPKV